MDAVVREDVFEELRPGDPSRRLGSVLDTDELERRP